MSEPLIEPSPEIWYRDDLAILCNWRKLNVAVEVGVERGNWAAIFLDRWQGYQWWGVDDYTPYKDMQFPRESDYQMAIANLQPYSHRAKLLRMSSVEAAKLFLPETIDFVYLDASHDYQNVKADLEAWWDKISPKGVIGGHDWTDQEVHSGVKNAVKEFAVKHDLTIYLTSPVPGYNEEFLPSWYAYKYGIPGPDWRRC